MTNHILCAVDLTHLEDAKYILNEAGRIADFENSGLSVVTVLPDYGSSFVGSFFQEGTLKKASQSALETLHKLAETQAPKQEHVQCIVEIGSVYEKVLKAASACHADLIVVSAHKPDLPDRIMGPNAARIVRYANCSVNVLRR